MAWEDNHPLWRSYTSYLSPKPTELDVLGEQFSSSGEESASSEALVLLSCHALVLVTDDPVYFRGPAFTEGLCWSLLITWTFYLSKLSSHYPVEFLK